MCPHASRLIWKLALLVGCLLPAVATADERPNILFIFTDDHAPHAIGAYDGWLKSVDPTPNIDQLAKQGMVFRNSFCTNSICGPSRAVIQTGKHSHKNGFMRNTGKGLDQSQWTVSKTLQVAGYNTAVIGKWHLKTTPLGFDHWEVFPGQGNYYNPVGAFTFTYVAALIGKWNAAGTDLVWEASRDIRLTGDQSSRGANECAVIELSTPGHVFMVMRGSNAPNPKGVIPAVKWKTLSTDFGRTWSA